MTISGRAFFGYSDSNAWGRFGIDLVGPGKRGAVMKKFIVAVMLAVSMLMFAAACSAAIEGTVSEVKQAVADKPEGTEVTITGYVPMSSHSKAVLMYDEYTNEMINCILADGERVDNVKDNSIVTLHGKTALTDKGTLQIVDCTF